MGARNTLHTNWSCLIHLIWSYTWIKISNEIFFGWRTYASMAFPVKILLLMIINNENYRASSIVRAQAAVCTSRQLTTTPHRIEQAPEWCNKSRPMPTLAEYWILWYDFYGDAVPLTKLNRFTTRHHSTKMLYSKRNAGIVCLTCIANLPHWRENFIFCETMKCRKSISIKLAMCDSSRYPFQRRFAIVRWCAKCGEGQRCFNR